MGFMLLCIITAMLHPTIVACFAFVWLIGRVEYFRGYQESVENRNIGNIIQHLGDLPVLAIALRDIYIMYYQ